MITLKGTTEGNSKAPMRRLVLDAVITAVMVACSPSDAVSDRIGTQVRRTGAVDVAKLTSFDWDTIYIFSPYSSREKMCQELPSAWADCRRTLPKYVDEGHFFIVFALDGKVVHHEPYARRNGDFCTSSCALKLARSEAKFEPRVVGSHANGDSYSVLFPLGALTLR